MVEPVRLDPTAVVDGLLDAARQLRSAEPIEVRMANLCRTVTTLLGCDRSSIMVRDGAGFRPKYTWGYPAAITERFLEDYSVPANAPIVAEMCRTRRAVVLDEARTTEVLGRLAELARIEALVLAPLATTDAGFDAFMTAEYTEGAAAFDETAVEVVLGVAGLALGPLFEHQLRQRSQDDRTARRNLRRFVQAEVRARRRIGRELHDTVLQDLLAHALQLEFHASMSPDAVPGLPDVVAGCRETAHRLQAIVEDLHPQTMESTTMAEALDGLLERKAVQGGWEASIFSDLAVEPGNAPRIVCYRVVQHVLEQLLLEGAPTQVALSLNPREDGFELRIEADGPPVELSKTSEAYVISTLEEGAALVGGEYSSVSGPDGIRCRLHLPYQMVDVDDDGTETDP